MPEAVSRALLDFQTAPPLVVFVRLLVALGLGAMVAVIYRVTRPAADVSPSFPATLVLLCILIAMVTQVIGDNVARAFSLVGALSIVRFRTVVRDTQDTAFVIFAVGVGMAIGAGNPWLAAGGLGVVAIAAIVMKQGPAGPLRSGRPDVDGGGGMSAAGLAVEGEPFELEVRVGIGHDPQVVVGPTLAAHTLDRRLMSLSTARQGLVVDAMFQAALRSDQSADALLRALNTLEGVQSVTLRRVRRAEDEL
jgi:hypothetical protein